MSRLSHHNRLAALVGEEQAAELMEAPKAHLGGQSPQDLIDQGNSAPVESLIRDMEANAGVSKPSHHSIHSMCADIDDHAADPIHDHIPQQRASKGAGKIFAILDELERGRR